MLGRSSGHGIAMSGRAKSRCRLLVWAKATKVTVSNTSITVSTMSLARETNTGVDIFVKARVCGKAGGANSKRRGLVQI